MNFATTAQYQANSGDFSVNLLVNDLLDKAGKFNQAGVHGNATVSVANWPMAVIDQLAHTGDVAATPSAPNSMNSRSSPTSSPALPPAPAPRP